VTLRGEGLRALRFDGQLALLLLHLHYFKAFNDRVGHLAGDAVLAQVAEQLRNEIRSVDIGCRVGGDEFAVVMPESTEDDASQLFDRMRDGVSTMPMPGGHQVRLSAGIAELRHGETAAGLFERADAALRRSKDTGKNRATTASE
jgi:diguanylate cyclase (GGDEF)-like protein